MPVGATTTAPVQQFVCRGGFYFLTRLVGPYTLNRVASSVLVETYIRNFVFLSARSWYVELIKENYQQCADWGSSRWTRASQKSTPMFHPSLRDESSQLLWLNPPKSTAG